MAQTGRWARACFRVSCPWTVISEELQIFVHSGLASRLSRVRMYVLSSYAGSWKMWNVLGRILEGFHSSCQGQDKTREM